MKLLQISTSVVFHTRDSLSSPLSTEDSTILNVSQTQRSLLLSSAFTSSVTRGTLATTQAGEQAEEEVDAREEEDGDEKDDPGKLWVVLEVQEGIASRLA